MTVTLIHGSPGSGKTHYLIEIIKKNMDKKWVYVTYSRSLMNDAKNRINIIDEKEDEYGNNENRDKHLIGTLHSLGYKLLGLKREDLYTNKMLLKFMNKNQIELNLQDISKLENATDTYELSVGAKIIMEFSVHRLAKRELMEINGYTDDINYLYKEYKKDKGSKYDYTDIIEKIVKTKRYFADVDILLVDECQDLSVLMFDMIDLWIDNAKDSYLTGDSDQCIYTYQGSNPNLFLKHKCDREEIMPKSYRLKENIYKESLKVIKKAQDYKEKHLSVEQGGKLIYTDYNIEDLRNIKETTFILNRTNYINLMVRNKLIEYGIPFRPINIKHNYLNIWNEEVIAINNILYKINNKSLEITSDEIMILLKYIRKQLLDKIKVSRLKIKIKKESVLKNSTHMYSAEDLLNCFVNKNITYKTILSSLYKIDDKYIKTIANHIELVNNRNCLIKDINDIKLKIGTIHSVKGMEADTVIYNTDTTNKVIKGMFDSINFFDNEIRLKYVAMTRAKKQLIITKFNYTTNDF
jgi:DNA helicase-2/ATP-dependent DNA helicase PcrA